MKRKPYKACDSCKVFNEMLGYWFEKQCFKKCWRLRVAGWKLHREARRKKRGTEGKSFQSQSQFQFTGKV